MTLRKATRVTPDGRCESIESAIISESFVDLYVNGKLWKRMACTASYIKELAVGHLVAEGWIHCVEDIESAYIDEDAKCVRLQLKSSVEAFKEEFSIMQDASYEAEWIFRMIEAFTGEGKLHKQTKAAHSCVLGRRGDVIFQCEDIGRHNAMDKVLGYMCLHGIPPKECMIFTSGRVPTEMAKKAVAAGVPVLISKAVPTDKALEMAQKYNLKLICKAWPDSFEIFN